MISHTARGGKRTPPSRKDLWFPAAAGVVSKPESLAQRLLGLSCPERKRGHGAVDGALLRPDALGGRVVAVRLRSPAKSALRVCFSLPLPSPRFPRQYCPPRGLGGASGCCSFAQPSRSALLFCFPLPPPPRFPLGALLPAARAAAAPAPFGVFDRRRPSRRPRARARAKQSARRKHYPPRPGRRDGDSEIGAAAAAAAAAALGTAPSSGLPSRAPSTRPSTHRRSRCAPCPKGVLAAAAGAGAGPLARDTGTSRRAGRARGSRPGSW